MTRVIYTDPTISKWEKQPKKKWSVKRKTMVVTACLVIAILGAGGWFGSRIISSIDKVFHGNLFSDVQALFSQNTLKNTNGRVNILVAGDSADDPGHAGADLTDSIMVLSINTKNNTAFMLSIPRDMWVYIPGLNSYQKINAANDVTKFSSPGLPSGGMGQLQQIVQNDLGIPIDYYALVNYQAFKDSVNAVGGITVDIQSPDPRGLYDSYTHLDLPNGEDYLNGQTALDLARARCDGGTDICYGFPDTDFDRTMHQRQMVEAVVKKATTLGVISNPVKVTDLFNAIGNNVQTNLSLKDALQLAKLAKKINQSNIGSYTYSSSTTGVKNPLLVSYDTDGQDALIPAAGINDFTQLQDYYDKLAGIPPTNTSALTGSSSTGSSTGSSSTN